MPSPTAPSPPREAGPRSVAAPPPPAGGAVEPSWRLALTDEEVLALADDPRGLVLLPFASSLPPDQLAAAVRTARRGLVLRGLLPAQALDEDGAEPADLVADVFVVRGNAEAVLAVQRTTATGPPLLRYLHLAADVALVEDVTADGIHLFGVADRAGLPQLLQGFLVPPGAVDGRVAIRLGEHPTPATGGGEHAWPGHALAVLAGATVSVDVVVRRVGDGVDTDHPPDLTGFFLGPGGCHRVRARVGAAGPLVAEPVRAEHVGSLVAGLLDPPDGRLDP